MKQLQGYLGCVSRPAPATRSYPSFLVQAGGQHSSQLSRQFSRPREVVVPDRNSSYQEPVKPPLKQLTLPLDIDEVPGSPAAALDYNLAIDYTATKTVYAVVDKCRCFLSVSAQNVQECTTLLEFLEALHDILQAIEGTADLDIYRQQLEKSYVTATKAYAFIEKITFKATIPTWWMPNKVAATFSSFGEQFHSQKVQLHELHNRNEQNLPTCIQPRGSSPSFGVTTFFVPTLKSSKWLYRKKRVLIPLINVEDGTTAYTVVLTYPRTWRNKDVSIGGQIESSDRGFSQMLEVDMLKLEKGSWGWDSEQHTAVITYSDLLVATVSSISGSLLTFNSESNKPDLRTQKYRINMEIMSRGGIDADLRSLFIVGTKQRGYVHYVHYKCFVNSESEEVVAIYRYHRSGPHEPQNSHGTLHVLGRGNQKGLRHLIVSAFSSLGFTDVL